MKLLHTTGFFNPVALLDETEEEKKVPVALAIYLSFFLFQLFLAT